MKVEYCILDKGTRFSHIPLSYTFGDVNNAIVKCTEMNKKYHTNRYKVAQITYEDK